MRPKKRILLVDGDEGRLSVRKFVLETRGFAVARATSGGEALEMVRRQAFNVMIVDLSLPDLSVDGMGTNQLILEAKRIDAELPALLVSEKVPSASLMSAADRWLGKEMYCSQQLVDAAKILAATKRGPKPAAKGDGSVVSAIRERVRQSKAGKAADATAAA